MKKYTLFSFVFILGFLSLFNIDASSASATNCAPGDLFNTATGKACGTPAFTECKPGDLFNSTTGKPCPVVSGGGRGDSETDLSDSVAKFNDLFKSSFKIGKRGDDVKALQQFLKDEGYYFGKVDGKYGKISARAVKDFQDDNNITISRGGGSGESGGGGSISSITVLSPNGGEKLEFGKTYTIKWNTTISNPLEGSTILLCRADTIDEWNSSNCLGEIADLRPSQALQYEWKVGSYLKPGSSSVMNNVPIGQYKIIIETCFSGFSDKACFLDISDVSFSIIAASGGGSDGGGGGGSGSGGSSTPTISVSSAGTDVVINPALLSTSNAIFTANVTDGSGKYKYYWNFGDGAIINDSVFYGNQNVMGHRYSTPGTYLVSVYVIDSNNQKSNIAGVNVTARLANVASSITVLSPNGGEQWAKGTTQTIKWLTTPGANIAYVSISLVPVSDSIHTRTIVANVANTGSYSWSIPNCTVNVPCSSNFEMLTGSYFIRVYDSKNNVVDESDAPFSIVAASGGGSGGGGGSTSTLPNLYLLGVDLIESDSFKIKICNSGASISNPTAVSVVATANDTRYPKSGFAFMSNDQVPYSSASCGIVNYRYSVLNMIAGNSYLVNINIDASQTITENNEGDNSNNFQITVPL